MARRNLMAILAAVLCASSASAKDSEPMSLARTGKWIADFDTENCKLQGEFGTGDDQVTLRMTQFRPGDSFTLSLYGRPFRSQHVHSRIGLAFGPDMEPVQRDVNNGTAGETPMVFVGSWRLDNRQISRPDEVLPAVTPAQEAAVRTLDFRVRGKAYRLQLGSMVATMQTLRRCMDGLVASWGFDPAEQATLSQAVAPAESPARWMISNDYPLGSLMRRERGIIHFRLGIDETGKATACTILSATRPKGFEDITCRLLLQRGVFRPALNREGKAVKSFWISSVRWDLPG